MKLFVTGGSGDLGVSLSQAWLQQNKEENQKGVPFTVINYDRTPPPSTEDSNSTHYTYVEGDLSNRDHLNRNMAGAEVIVHIAALHGIHEFKGVPEEEFWSVNVTGTYNVLNAAKSNGVTRIVFLSSEAVDNMDSIYGLTKRINEQTMSYFALHHGFEILSLRARAFIPHTNKYAYSNQECVFENFVSCCQFQFRGFVHLTDICQATLLSIQYVLTHPASSTPATASGSSKSNTAGYHITLLVDGPVEYSEEELSTYDSMTFLRHYSSHPLLIQLADKYSLNYRDKPLTKPQEERSKILNLIGYQPKYGRLQMLQELQRQEQKYGAEKKI